MLLLLFVIGFIIGISLIRLSKNEFEYKFIIGVVLTIATGFIIAVSSIIVVVDYSTAEAKHAKLLAEREGIIYEMLMPEAKDELYLQNKEILDSAKQFNTELAYNKSVQRNIWVGIYYPNIYDDIEYIKYEDFYEFDINMFDTEEEMLY